MIGILSLLVGCCLSVCLYYQINIIIPSRLPPIQHLKLFKSLYLYLPILIARCIQYSLGLIEQVNVVICAQICIICSQIRLRWVTLSLPASTQLIIAFHLQSIIRVCPRPCSSAATCCWVCWIASSVSRIICWIACSVYIIISLFCLWNWSRYPDDIVRVIIIGPTIWSALSYSLSILNG